MVLIQSLKCRMMYVLLPVDREEPVVSWDIPLVNVVFRATIAELQDKFVTITAVSNIK